MNHTQNGDKIATVLKAWSDLRPNKSFGGLTLAEFKAKVGASVTLRERIAKTRLRLAALLVQRAQADAAALPIVQRVVNGVIADADETNNGVLYERMGYVRKNARATGLSRKRGKGGSMSSKA